MSTLCCKKCESADFVKSGHTRGHQRYKCRACGCQFTATPPRGVPAGIRQLGVVLYAHFGVSMSGVARLCKVSVQAVMKWICAASDDVQPPKMVQSGVVQVDEMWHFVSGKKTKFGSGGPFVGHHVALSDSTSGFKLIKA
jgi:transposase-like protein